MFTDIEIFKVFDALLESSVMIYDKVKQGAGLDYLSSTNSSDDEQLALDVWADDCFRSTLADKTDVAYILSEEQTDWQQYGGGKYSVALDPLDGSKSALVGIPSGAIFGIFKDIEEISLFNGSNIVCGGFFVFGINLEVFFSVDNKAYRGEWDQENEKWHINDLVRIPSHKMIAINASNHNKWDGWLRTFYDQLINDEDEEGKSYNMRWYASMVSEVKRLLLQGGMFAYPSDSRKGYEQGHLRLVYEAVPMAFLIESLGGASSDGTASILAKGVKSLHQKTPVFLGDKQLIEAVEKARRNAL